MDGKEHLTLSKQRGESSVRAEDFKKVYGLTEEQYQTLSPYIYFTAEDTIRKATSLLTLQQAPKDSIYKISGRHRA